MRQTHPEGMDEGPRRLGRSERLIMGDFDRHGLSFAVERSIANSYRLVVLRSPAAAGVQTTRVKRPGGAQIRISAAKGGGGRCRKRGGGNFLKTSASGERTGTPPQPPTPR